MADGSNGANRDMPGRQPARRHHLQNRTPSDDRRRSTARFSAACERFTSGHGVLGRQRLLKITSENEQYRRQTGISAGDLQRQLRPPKFGGCASSALPSRQGWIMAAITRRKFYF